MGNLFNKFSYLYKGPVTIITTKNMRKLLLKEINKLIGNINKDGLTIIPTKVYFKKGKAKVEIAIAKGKGI